MIKDPITLTLSGSGDQSSHGRIQPLDGLRGLAALMVVAYHYIFIRTTFAPGTLGYILRAPLKFTWSGVDLFFVLSGFLITTILIKTRFSPNYYQTFFIRRSTRILPLYFLLCLSFVVAMFSLPPNSNLISNQIPLWTYFIFVQNIAMWLAVTGGALWIGPTWSLAVEEQFYLIVPNIVRWTSPKIAISCFILLTVLAPVLRYFFPSPYAFMFTPFRTDSLLVGSILAYAMQSSRFVAACRARVRELYVALGILLVGICIMMVRRDWFEPFDFTWLSAFYMLIILLVQIDPERFIAKILSHPILLWFGGMSFAIYMFHEAVLGLAEYYLRGSVALGIRNNGDIVITAVAFAATCGLAVLSSKYLESPIRRWGHRSTY